MQDAVLNLCRVKLRDQQRLDRVGYLEEYPQYPNGEFGEAVPRGGNAGGGGQPGWVVKCKGWESDPNAYIYFTIQEQNWERTAEAIGRPEWVDDPGYSTARARQDKIFDIFAEIEKWLADKTKYEAVDILRKWEVPCAPVLSMKEIADDPTLRKSGSVVEVEQKGRGTYPDRRQPDQVLGVQARDQGRAAARRAHRRGPCRAGLRRGHHRQVAREEDRRLTRRPVRTAPGHLLGRFHPFSPCGGTMPAGKEASAMSVALVREIAADPSRAARRPASHPARGPGSLGMCSAGGDSGTGRRAQPLPCRRPRGRHRSTTTSVPSLPAHHRAHLPGRGLPGARRASDWSSHLRDRCGCRLGETSARRLAHPRAGLLPRQLRAGPVGRR